MTHGRLIALGVGAVICVATSTFALVIKDAAIKNGVVRIRGVRAQPDAVMTVEDQPAGTSTHRGRVDLRVTTLPADCVADVSDGVDTVQAVIKYCGPKGDPGVSGLDGLQCWDLDGDEVCDLDNPKEDITGDGVCTVDDCRPAGALTTTEVEPLQIVRGVVKHVGGPCDPAQVVSGSGFRVEPIECRGIHGFNSYRIEFEEPFGDTPAVTASATTTNSLRCVTLYPAESITARKLVRVQCCDSRSCGWPANFSFTAIGKRGCANDNDCPVGEPCLLGQCSPCGLCDDGIGCSIDSCDLETLRCVHEAFSYLCDDGDPNTNDTCSIGDGGCRHLPQP